MFEYISGKLEETVNETAVIDVNGIGYEIIVPLSTLEVLPKPGQVVKLYIHFHVREDAQKLYGFFTKSERDIFRKLNTISKIGPKIALNVLSGLSVKDIVYSVQTQDFSRLKAISGIGLKTAQRLVIELKGKLASVESDVSHGTAAAGGKRTVDRTIREDAFAAMVSLGYNEAQVVNALARVEQTIDDELPVEEWIKKALQVI